jgi:hypothetical protein
MRKFYLAGLLSGFIGGLFGAYVLAHVRQPERLLVQNVSNVVDKTK